MKQAIIRTIKEDEIDFPTYLGLGNPYIPHGFIAEGSALAYAKKLSKWDEVEEVILVRDSPVKGLVNVFRKVKG